MPWLFSSFPEYLGQHIREALSLVANGRDEGCRLIGGMTANTSWEQFDAALMIRVDSRRRPDSVLMQIGFQPSQARVQDRSGRKNFLEERSVDSAGVHLGWGIVWERQRTEPGTKCLAPSGRRMRLMVRPNWIKLSVVGLVG